ncbi:MULTISPECIES: ParA family protein [Lonsdalea]|uniref:Chromosome partitioning protein ParA n=2 Tax=Lonsdalea TaxID=1082702 RepID=A0ACD1J9S5_9GAMM|nr:MULTISPECIES: ParA family protein [Lonsdalea]RAT11115.1 chromosome partitioning protein ParA [Lonsdalea quercina]RAT19070.1 chromosome partitioning protein ParA [Lonsdalea populi]RAT20997.1 chromosome partitioning protein ParA [Lonsdalea populi]RAT23484.1 chromosome partitioning protein ParA [Lonsdalea populi]RAT30801.1 chromosome partitioning protein ParA [Lonsdalea populi]
MHSKSDQYNSIGCRTKILPVVSTKGGEGKSTQTANLGGFLADAGIKVLLIDGDHAQPTASSIYPLAYEAPCGLYELLMQTVDLSVAENIISNTTIDNLDVVVSNDPRNLLPTYMLNVADGRVRLRNALSHQLFSKYDVILIDSQGSRSVMSELIILAATGEMIGMVKPVLPDVREFMRGTVALMEELLPYSAFGISLPNIRMLVNCMDYTLLAKTTVEQAESIIVSGGYSQHSDQIRIDLLETRIYDLDVYKQGHASGLPVHRLEKKTTRKSDSAFDSMHKLACELFPEWKLKFDALVEEGEGK